MTMSTHARTEDALTAHLAASQTSPTSPPSIAVEPKPFLCRRPVRLTIYACFALLFMAMLAWRYVPGLLDPTFEKHIAEKRVMLVCRTLAEAYEFRRQQIGGEKVADHLRLAEWCIRYDLRAEAGRELAAARRLDRRHRRTSLLRSC